MEIEQAKQAIEQDKKERSEHFIKGLEELSKEFKCNLTVKYKYAGEDQPSFAEIAVVAL